MRQLAETNRKELKRFAKFAIVGAAGSVTDFTVLNVMIQVFGVSILLANTLSFTFAVVQNFFLNRIWTFPESRNRDARRQMLQFLVVSMVGLSINLIVVMLVHHALNDMWMSWFGPDMGYTISYNFAKAFAIGVVLFWNFTANRLWTYRGL